MTTPLQPTAVGAAQPPAPVSVPLPEAALAAPMPTTAPQPAPQPAVAEQVLPAAFVAAVPTAAPSPEPETGPVDEGLNLDTLEREDAPREPFPFTLNGHRYVVGDPRDLDWQTLLQVAEVPLRMMQALLPEEDQQRFFETKMPAWKLDKLAEMFLRHYELPPFGNASDSRA